MKHHCGISGLELETSLFPGTLRHAFHNHPIFSLEQHALLGYTNRYFTGSLSSKEGYLLYLALFHSTDLMRWNVPALFNADHTPKIVAQNMEHLIRIIGKINIIKHPAFQLPKISINRDTRTLENSSVWIRTWEQGLRDFLDGNRTQQLHERLIKRERALERLIKTEHKRVVEYIGQLTSWVSEAAGFPNTPNFNNSIPFPTTADYYKHILVSCARGTAWKIPARHIQELIDFCLDNLPSHGTIYSHKLFEVLHSGLDQSNNTFTAFTGGKTSYELLDANASVEEANKLAMIMAAPEIEPRPEQFSNKIEYLRALGRYRMAVDYKAIGNITVNNNTVPTNNSTNSDDDPPGL